MNYPTIATVAGQQDRRLPVFIPSLVNYPPIYYQPPAYFSSGMYREAPITASASNASTNANMNRLVNTKLCSRYLSKGYCKRRDCTFAHSVEELRPVPDLRCTKWCRFVFFGLNCNDSRCPYAHSKEELQPQPDEFKTTVCRFAKRGKCLNGEYCRFLHLPQDRQQLNHQGKRANWRANRPAGRRVGEDLTIIPLPNTEAEREITVSQGEVEVSAPPSTPASSVAASAGANMNIEARPRLVNRSRPTRQFAEIYQSSEAEDMPQEPMPTNPASRFPKGAILVPNSLSRDTTRDELHASVETTLNSGDPN
ncbi:hypothetical protein ETH_00029000 [Eimeria tenella]|uniref:C3H1-type domain-containing protein n=1 Tax=Eimeria tenella TaxID=5802 RepID=U6KLU6_EIMTE|nr:hypothetical protein ETH_00029000 [Eimeria tenella]CDJ38941.1 hypothetical protein ETH_00029000 [Eimeria tenella]|eukprot:XP_013229696.1 hypothetical protein ETH_00029000 [Eimeria tenella]